MKELPLRLVRRERGERDEVCACGCGAYLGPRTFSVVTPMADGSRKVFASHGCVAAAGRSQQRKGHKDT